MVFPYEIKDKAVLEGKGYQYKDEPEYHISYDDFVKVMKPPYVLKKRDENQIWYLWFRQDGKDVKLSTGEKKYSFAREKSKEIWTEHTDKLYAK